MLTFFCKYFSSSYYRSSLNNSLSITGTITFYISIYIIRFFGLLPFFIIFATTDFKHNNPCNYSTRLFLTILSTLFFAYLSRFNLFFTVIFICAKQNKMVVVVVAIVVIPPWSAFLD